MNNPMQLIQMAKNPQNFMNMVINNSEIMKNPIMSNAVNMVQKGDSKGLESLARNLCKEKGVNPDEMIQQIKTQIGI